MTYRELTRRLKRCGCQFARQGKGDHEIWVSDKTQSTTTIPNWGSRDLKPGTVGAILRDLGISRDEFNRGIVDHATGTLTGMDGAETAEIQEVRHG